MKQWQRVAGISGLTAVVLAGSLLAQQAQITDKAAAETPQDRLGTADIEFQIALMKEHTKELQHDETGPEAAQAVEKLHQYHDLFVAATHDSTLARTISRQSLWLFSRHKLDAQSAPQVCQVAAEQTFMLSLLQTEQNQRIIELLEQIAKKPK